MDWRGGPGVGKGPGPPLRRRWRIWRSVWPARLDNEAAELDSDTRRRIEAVCRSLQRRGSVTLKGWRDMLKCIGQPTTPGFVDWFGIERQDGRDMDVGMYRHYVDPTSRSSRR